MRLGVDARRRAGVAVERLAFPSDACPICEDRQPWAPHAHLARGEHGASGAWRERLERHEATREARFRLLLEFLGERSCLAQEVVAFAVERFGVRGTRANELLRQAKACGFVRAKPEGPSKRWEATAEGRQFVASPAVVESPVKVTLERGEPATVRVVDL